MERIKMGYPTFTKQHHISHFIDAFKNKKYFYFGNRLSVCMGYDANSNSVNLGTHGIVYLENKYPVTE